MRAYSAPRRCVGQVNVPLLTGVVVVVAAIVAAIYFLWPQPEPLPAPGQPRATPLETVAPAQSAQERGDSARDVIKRLQANSAIVDYSDAHLRASEFQAAGSLADAQLLYFFAARGGYSPAAFELATMYDPLHFSTNDSLMEAPDAFQAYKWYRSARDAGDGNATTRLVELRAWAQSAADAGDDKAERLLLQWE